MKPGKTQNNQHFFYLWLKKYVNVVQNNTAKWFITIGEL